MAADKSYASIKIFTTITFLLMVAVNALANIIPINGVTTGQVSDSYPNLFAPAGLTFAIWGLIYLLLAGYVVYQLGLFRKGKELYEGSKFRLVSLLFSISSIANTLWIFAWHYYLIEVTMLLMIAILVCLIMISLLLKEEGFWVRLPFSVYFGWITVATIANVTTLLVSWGWRGGGLSEPLWASIIIIVGLAIGVATIIRNRDVAYGLVFVWAYVGILIKHMSLNGFAGQYTIVIATVLFSLLVLAIVEVYVYLSKRRRTGFSV